jgi:hypothetical protein
MRRSTALLLRRSIPLLLAVGALLGPGPAWAGGPAPDPASGGAPAPDAAPVHKPKAAAAPRAPVAVPVRKAAVAAATFTPPAASTPTIAAQPTKPVAAPVRKHVARAKKHAAKPAIKIIDVPPLRVDVHRGLGAVTRSLHDDSLLLLAGIALLVATFTAASGTTLAVIATRTPRRRG